MWWSRFMTKIPTKLNPWAGSETTYKGEENNACFFLSSTPAQKSTGEEIMLCGMRLPKYIFSGYSRQCRTLEPKLACQNEILNAWMKSFLECIDFNLPLACFCGRARNIGRVNVWSRLGSVTARHLRLSKTLQFGEIRKNYTMS